MYCSAAFVTLMYNEMAMSEGVDLVPLALILNQSREQSPGAKWLCLAPVRSA